MAFGFRTGFSRGKYGIPAPKTVGNETWERIYRVHQNTMEQLVVFIPALLCFAYYVSGKWAIPLGLAFLVFRQLYSVMYIKDPTRRMFPLTFLVNVILVIGSLIGIILDLVRTA
jgi:glutathione S-transferase